MQETSKPTATGLIGNLKSAFSIKENVSNVVANTEDEKPFDLNEVTKNLTAYGNSFADDENKVSLYFALNQARIYSDKDFIVSLEAKNSTVAQTLTEYKNELTQFLKNKMSYKFVKIEIELANNQQKAFVYSPMDKYNLICKDNPNVIKLKEAFDADITY